MRWNDRLKGTMPIETAVYLAFAMFCLGLVFLVWAWQSTAQAQTFYSTEEGTGFALELMPGVTYFAGPSSGFAIETLPGVTRFDLERADGSRSRGTLYDFSAPTMPERRAPTARDSLLDLGPPILDLGPRSWERR